jgi:hypothetical protein
MKKIYTVLMGLMLVFTFASISFASGMSQHKLSLKKGWNLVGGVLNNVQVENILKKDFVNSAWKWNAGTGSWEVFSPDENIQNVMNKYQIKGFNKVNAGEGYWINAKADAEVYTIGEPPQIPSMVNASSVDPMFSDEMDEMDNESMNNPETVEPKLLEWISNSEIVTYSGEVVQVPQIGVKSMNGFKINTDEGEITIYGLGPKFVWDNATIDRPVEGDNITVEAFKIVLDNDTVRNVAISITDDEGNSLKLRDENTGLPLWAKGMMGLEKGKKYVNMMKKQFKWGKKWSND